MKYLFKILLIFSILVSCINSPEQKIKKDLKLQNRLNLKIYDVIITDTIYEDELHFKINEIYENINIQKNKMQYFHNKKDSLFKIKNKDFIIDSLIKDVFNNLMFYKRDFDNNEIQLLYHRQLLEKTFNGISGYYANIKTENGNYPFIVTTDFQILCPTFMFE
jgi:hypothetical protein